MSGYIVKVEEAREGANGKPSAGPVYRCIYAKDGLMELPTGLDSPWDLFSKVMSLLEKLNLSRRTPKIICLVGDKLSMEKYKNSIPFLAGPYVWLTYEEVYNTALLIGSAIRSRGVNHGGCCGIYGANCPEWIMAMEACNSQGVTYVPLYDTLGANAVEFMINHAEVSISFVQESKISEILSYQREEAEKLGVACFSWDEFVLLGQPEHEVPAKRKTDLCTIMYTSGTTGEPKGVILKNEAFTAEVLSVDQLISETDKSVSQASGQDVYFSFLPLAHIFDQDVRYLIEDLMELKPTLFCGVPRVYDRICSGLTESCGGCLTSIADVYSMTGSVGVPMTTIEVRLESVPEMGYNAVSDMPRGEICLRGTTLFSGYHKREDITKEVLVDGWFHTGDIGEWQPDGSMKIIDRKKNIFKLSQGEYVAVESLESTYSRCPLVTMIWVYGNSFESFLVAVVVPERKSLADWASNNNVDGDFNSLCNNLKARQHVLDEMNSTAKKHQLRGFEMLKAVHLEPVPFDIDRDLITPTFKLKRPQLIKYYKDVIDILYTEAKGSIKA
ncbi:hypothetical protein Leryth_020012 [Lithospermum erythrorhizon]|nr:hypothetical protein Leryth_020012 [Lithospermum erythrorhizon]